MRLTEGLYRDIIKEDQPQGTSPEVWNMVKNKMNGIYSNEPGFMKLPELDTPGRVYLGDFSLYNSSVILSKSSEGDEIGILEEGEKYRALLTTDLLKLPTSQHYKGVVYTNSKGERIVIWTDKVNDLRYYNVDNPALKNGDVITESSILKLNFFLSFRMPEITKASVNDFGGTLLSGTYFFNVSYEEQNTHTTNYSTISKPVTVHKSTSPYYTKNEGDQGGIGTSKSIELEIQSLDTNYPKFYIGVLGYIKGELQAWKMGPYDVEPQKTITLSSMDKGEPVLVEELTIPSAVFKKIESLTLHDDKIYLAGLTYDEQTDYRELANNIEVNWVYEDKAELKTTEGYRKGDNVYLKTSFMPGEVVSLFMSCVLHNGVHLPGVHIPGRAVRTISGYASALENEKLATLTPENGEDFAREKLINDDIKYFHTRETASADGTMGYWENEALYPDDYPGLGGQPVRHHKLPFLSSLHQWKEAYEYDVKEGNFAIEIGLVGNESYSVTETQNNGRFTSSDVAGSKRITANEPVDILMDVSAYNNTIINRTLSITTSLNNEVTTAFSKTSNVEEEISYSKYISLNTGDYIEVYQNSSGGTMDGHVILLPTNVGGGEPIGNLGGKVLGLSLSNIQIPDSLKGKVQRVEFYYGKRDFSNSTMLSQGMAFMENKEGRDQGYGNYIDKVRYHGFELLVNENYPTIPVSHIRKEYRVLDPTDYWRWDGSHLVCMEEPDDNTRNSKVDSYEYQPYSAEFKKETAFRMDLRDSISAPYGYATIISLVAFKKNVYDPFELQDMVFTGAFVDTYQEDEGMYSLQKVYGGDTFVSLYGFRVLPELDENGDLEDFGSHMIPVYSPYNINMRYGGESRDEMYVPKDYLPSAFEIDAEIEPDITSDDFDNHVAISTDFNKLSDLNPVYPRQTKDVYRENAPNTVAMGEPFNRENDEGNIRKFKPLNYSVLGKESGKITNIESTQDGIIIHTQYSILKTAGKVKIQSTSDAITIGDGDIFSVKPQSIIKTKTGYAGTQHTSSCLNSEAGYFFIEHDTGKAFLIGEKIQEVSNFGMREFFKENSTFKLKEQFKKADIDVPDQNPGVLIGYSVVYDDKFKRLIISKRDYEITSDQAVTDGDYTFDSGELKKYDSETDSFIPVNLDNDPYVINRSYTISLSIGTPRWASLHTYYPHMMFYNRKGVFSFKEGVGYKHNEGSPGVYYGQQVHRSWADYIYNENKALSKVLSSLLWMTATEGPLGADSFCTYTEMAVFNDHQSSGEITLHTKPTDPEKNVNHVQGEYRFNSFKDLADLSLGPVLNADGSINENAVNHSKKWYERKRFISKVFTIRAFINNSDGNFVYLLDIIPRIKQSIL